MREMTYADSLALIPDDKLFATVQRLTAQANVALADLLAHLARWSGAASIASAPAPRFTRTASILGGLHAAPRGCADAHPAPCELRMSEDAAFRRSKAARL